MCDRFGHHALVLNAQTALIRSEADALVKCPRSGKKVEQVLALLKKIKEVTQELDRWFDETPAKWRRTSTGTAPPLPSDPGPAGGSTSAPLAAAAGPSLSHWISPTSARSAASLSSPPSATSPTSPCENDHEATTYGSITAFPSLPLYTFPNVWAAGKYINANISHLILQQAACRCISWLCAPSDHRQIKEYRDAFAEGSRQVDDLLASTPYFFGWTGDALTTPHFPCGTADTPKGLSFICCLWPLYYCGMSIFATRRQRAYIKGRLNAIWEIMGIRQADVFAKVRWLQRSRCLPRC